MAGEEEKLTTDERVRRSVGRTLARGSIFLLVLGLLVGWGSLGAFTLKPGEAAVLLLLGRHYETITADGFHWTIPPPIVTRDVVNFTELRNEDFGYRGEEDENTPRQKLVEASMQTGDNNIVRVSFAVQYNIKDPFLARYRIAEPGLVVRDAAQAAMREVVGHETVDGVLRERREAVASETRVLLQDILDSYEAGLSIDAVQLQGVEVPVPVRAAFNDVVAATQDASRLVNEAEGYRNEALPAARGEAAELVAGAEGYRDAKIAEATGAAERFRVVAVEYRKAPEVTQKRLYLETMEQILPEVDKVIIEPGTTQVLPYLPLRGGAAAGGQP